MFPLSVSQEKFNDGLAKRLCGGPHQGKEGIGLAMLQDWGLYILYFVRNHFWVHRKAILLKGNEVNMMIWLLKCLEVATKNTHPLSHTNLLSKAKSQNSVTPTSHSDPPSLSKTEAKPNPSISVLPAFLSVPSKSVTNFLVSHFLESVPPSSENRSHREVGPTLC